VSPAVLPERLLRRVQDQDARPDIHSLLLFSPLHGVERAVADKAYNTVSLHKDADGLNEASREHATGFLPATALAVAGLMKANGIDAAAQGRLVTRIGDGLTVGKPLGRIHAEQGVDELVITSKHSKQELDQAVAKADIVIAAAGFPGLVTPDMLRAGQTVIGVGRRDIGASVYEAWRDRDLSITHEGGVGPLTSAFMHEHMLQSAQDNVLGSLATLELVEFGAELLEEDARHLVRA
jgi:methylenetetrahydrofolate dehydrogenase (NADP+)/methenyltetrahydrofolate cyclohydrolase